jgi:plastocyanin
VTLQFLNAATIEHGLRFGAPINAGTPDRVAPQDNVEFQFTAPSEPGEYEFVCPVHPNMKGRLIVSETVGP